ncbi:hypothetical protein PATSB16_32740 [Pandoraea thiooxydans]|nr:hypothetical protein PATSB16_32740 [Pandoraea thiooxydans]
MASMPRQVWIDLYVVSQYDAKSPLACLPLSEATGFRNLGA